MSRRAAGSTPPPWLADVAELIAQRTGLSRIALRLEQLERADLRSALSEPRLPVDLTALDPSACRDQLVENDNNGAPTPWDALIDEVTVRETYFFRHPEHFQLLRTRVLPELRARGALERGLYAWSAGCASGEEPYSLAMVFAEEGLLDKCHVLATDLSRAALACVRNATYREWSLRALDSRKRAQHFTAREGLFEVREHLKQHVTARQLNLAEPTYPAASNQTRGLSLIFCRNVLMFFDPVIARAVASRLYDALDPGGWLFTGPSDLNLADHTPFHVHVAPGGLVYQKPLTAASERAVSIVQPASLMPRVIPVSPQRPLSVPPPMAAVVAPPPVPTRAVDSASAVREVWNNRGAAHALVLCTQALESAKYELELHYLKALLLWELRRHGEAAREMRSVLFLDRSHAMGHYGLAAISEAAGDHPAACRSYRNVIALCASLRPDATLPLGDGLLASGVCRAAEHGLRRLALPEDRP